MSLPTLTDVQAPTQSGSGFTWDKTLSVLNTAALVGIIAYGWSVSESLKNRLSVIEQTAATKIVGDPTSEYKTLTVLTRGLFELNRQIQELNSKTQKLQSSIGLLKRSKESTDADVTAQLQGMGEKFEGFLDVLYSTSLGQEIEKAEATRRSRRSRGFNQRPQAQGFQQSFNQQGFYPQGFQQPQAQMYPQPPVQPSILKNKQQQNVRFAPQQTTKQTSEELLALEDELLGTDDNDDGEF